MIFYEPNARDKGILPHDPMKAIVAPRPIGWISTRALDGRVNLAPYSFFNAFSSSPMILGFSSEGMKDTAAFAIESGEFVANLVTFDLFKAMSDTSAPLPRGMSEFDYVGLTMADGRLIKAPRVAKAHAAFECKVVETVRLKTHTGCELDYYLILGEVIGVHIDEALIVEGRFDTAGARPVGRCGYQDYAVVDKVIPLTRPPGGGNALKG